MLDRSATIHAATMDDVLAAIAALTDQVRTLCGLVEARCVGVAVDTDTVTVPVAAAIVRRSQETVRNWCRRSVDPIGYYDAPTNRYRVSKAKLQVYLQKRLEAVPPALD